MRWRTTRPPSSWLWLLTLFTVAGFAETMFYGHMMAFTPLYLPQLGIAPVAVPQWTGAIAAISSALGLPFLPFWGALADRYSRQPLIIRSFVAHNTGLMMATLGERVPRGRLGLAFAVMNSAPPLGAAVGPLLGGPLVDAWGFRALLGCDVAVMLLVILLLACAYRDTFIAPPRSPILRMVADSLRLIGDSPRLRALFPALFLLFGGWMLAVTYLPLAIGALYQGDAPGRAIGLVLGFGGLATLLCAPALGSLADRYGYWRVLFLGALGEVVLWPIPALTQNLVGFTLAWALLNGVASGVFAVSFSVLSESVPASVRGRVMTFAYLPVNIGFVVGPALGGVVTLAFASRQTIPLIPDLAPEPARAVPAPVE
jgi:MFS family permease